MLRFLLRRETLIDVGRATAALAAGFFLLATPYIVHLSVETGRWGAITRKAGITLAISLNESGILEGTDIRADVDSLVFVDFIQRHPFLYFEKVVRDIPAALGVYFEALHYPFVPFLLLGLFLMFRERLSYRKDLLLLTFVGFCIAGFMLVYVKRRYSLQAVPISLGWVGLGIAAVIEFTRSRFRPPSGRMICVFVALLLLGDQPPQDAQAYFPGERPCADGGLVSEGSPLFGRQDHRFVRCTDRVLCRCDTGVFYTVWKNRSCSSACARTALLLWLQTPEYGKTRSRRLRHTPNVTA